MRKKWLIPVVSIIVVIASILGIKAWHVYETTEIIEEKTVQLSTFEEDAIERIEVRDDKTSKYRKVNGQWVNEDYPQLKYDQDKMEEVVTALGNLIAEGTIRNIQDLDTYGINEYARVITAYNPEGEKEVLAIGKYAEDKQSYYIWAESKKMIGLVPEACIGVLTSDLGQLVEEEVVLPAFDTIEEIKVKTQEKSVLEITKIEDEWVMDAPYDNQYPVKTELVEAYDKWMRQIRKETFIDTIEGNEEKYGLDYPTLQMTLNNEVWLTFGKNQEGSTYFTYKDEPFVYSINTAQLKELQQVKPFEWLTGSIRLPKKEDIQAIEIISQTKELTIPIENVMTEAQEQFITALLQLKIHAPIAQASLETSSPREAELTLVFTTKDGEVRKLEFIPYDPSFYLLRDEGVVAFSIEKKQLVESMKAINEGIQ